MNGGLNVEICDTDLNCCNAGSLDSDRDDFNKGITGFCLRGHWFRSTRDPFDLNSVHVSYVNFTNHFHSCTSRVRMWSRGPCCDRAMWTSSTATWSMAARRLCWRRAPLSSLSPTTELMVGRETGSGGEQSPPPTDPQFCSGSSWMEEPTSSVRWDSCWMTSRVPISPAPSGY